MVSEELPSVESMLAGAKLAGLPLTDEEAAGMVKGVGRMKDMGRVVRGLLESTTEPAPVFSPQREEEPK